jgi:murein DD-endopeptidase MepM/ murein hydrolase activator NlpD
MTRSPRRFPIASRFLVAVACLLVVVLVPGGSGSAVTKQEVTKADAKVKRLLQDVQSERARLSNLQQELVATTNQLDDAMGRLDETTAHLLETQGRLAEAQALHDRTVGRLNERAVQAFMGGAGQNFEFLVGASSLSDLSDRIEFMNVVAESDAELAQTVQNTQNKLDLSASQLKDLQDQQQAAVAQAKAAQAIVNENFGQQQALVDSIASKLAEAELYKKKISAAYQEALRAAAPGSYGGGHNPVPLPPGYEHVLERCPVDGPRSFGDSFGAPRYFGGYHPHKGVDFLSPTGTPIVAPFDGTASTGYNSAGGKTVTVSGARGYVYNAHLSSFTSLSSGSVTAGDVIGFVGDSGDAMGNPHLHFEFHPSVMPSSWPVSAYGYSIIDDAVNPYPLAVGACG